MTNDPEHMTNDLVYQGSEVVLPSEAADIGDIADAMGKMREEGRSTKERRQFLTDFLAKYGGFLGLAKGMLGSPAGLAVTTAVGAVAFRRLLKEIDRLFDDISADADRRVSEVERRAGRRELIYLFAGLLLSIPISIAINIFTR